MQAKSIRRAAALFVCLGGVGSALAQTSATSPTIEAPTTMLKPASSLSVADAGFLRDAIQSDYAEIAASQLALQKSQNADVKQFAQMMIEDHGKTRAALTALAQQKGLTPPSDASIVAKAKVKTIALLDGDRFDKQFARVVGVSAHEDAVKLFQKTAASATDPDVKALAAKTMPALEGHLKRAKDLQAHLEGS